MTLRATRNLHAFIAFRVLFNARWYYPVLAVLFLDLGLSLEQYALLNVAWAITIVCLEVPSGALADQIGRRRMLLLAAALMVAEMCLFAFAPKGSPWLFPILLLNRILSGAAEACASGADESLAYDSLVAEGRAAEWPGVLARLMRWQSGAFFVAMALGAAVYDPDAVGTFLGWLGVAARVPAEVTMRFPVYLTLGNALLVLGAVLRMREPGIHVKLPTDPDEAGDPAGSGVLENGAVKHPWPTVAGTVRQTIETARWLRNTPKAMLIIICGFCIDSVIRLFLTVNSNYFRLIAVPEAWFGVVGSAFALLGFLTPQLAKALAARFRPSINFAITSLLALAGLLVLAPFWRFWGVLAILPLGTAMSMLGFFVSHYLNEAITDSSRRATALSFKGLAFNLAYGAVGLLFAAYTRARHHAGTQDEVFIEAMRWLPPFFAALLAGVALLALRLRSKPRHAAPGP